MATKAVAVSVLETNRAKVPKKIDLLVNSLCHVDSMPPKLSRFR